MNSTKRHPRTLNEAFPHTMEYGAAIEIPAKAIHWMDKLANWSLAIGLGLALSAIACWELVK